MCGSLLFAVLVLGAPAPKADPKKDAGLVGEWKVERLTVAAEVEPPSADRKFLVFDSAGKYFNRNELGGKQKELGTYTVDPKANPMTIDLELISGARWKGICTVEGDTLTVCLTPLPDAPRPTAFESKRDSVDLLYVLKRAKNKD
jgi:uncharacterized protein (TIGR03067 family)